MALAAAASQQHGYMAMAQTQSHQNCSDHSHDHSHDHISWGIPDVTNLKQDNVVKLERTKKTGEYCLAIYLGEEYTSASYWLEGDFKCVSLKSTFRSEVGCTKDGLNFLKNLNNNNKIQDDEENQIISKKIIFGESLVNAKADHSKMTIINPIEKLIRGEDTDLSMSLISVILNYWYIEFKSLVDPKQKISSFSNNITVIVPNNLTQMQKSQIIKSAKWSRLNITHIFGRGVSGISGCFFRSLSTNPTTASSNELMINISDMIEHDKRVDVYLLHVHFMSLGNKDITAITPKGESSSVDKDAHLKSVLSGDCKAIEVSLIRCEQKIYFDGEDEVAQSNTNSKKKVKAVSKAPIPYNDFTRMTCIASSTITCSSNSAMDAKSAIKGWFDSTCLTLTLPSKISGVVANIATSDMQAIIDPSMLSPRGIGRCYQSSLDDISRGGCVLSAAELLSSRVAIPQGDPLYLLPIGEDILLYDIAVVCKCNDSTYLVPPVKESVSKRTVLKRMTLTNSSAPDILLKIFAGNRVMQKSNIGPTSKHHKYYPPTPKLDFYTGYVNIFGTFKPSYDKGYPICVLMQKDVVTSAPGTGTTAGKDEQNFSDWKEASISLPVIEVDEEYTHLHTEIAFEIDTSRGMCAVKATHMDPVEDVVDRFVVTRNVVGTLLFLVAIVVFLKMYWQYQTTQSYQQDYDWLNDFYLHNAPEKLKDEEFISRVLHKYEGKMFLLWRQVQKSYDVKWAPPASILDDTDYDEPDF